MGHGNEPINYLIASYGAGRFHLAGLVFDLPSLVDVLRDYLAIHAAIYTAIKANDTVDADGDGIAASVGFSMSVADWEPSRGNKPSTDPDDIAARDAWSTSFTTCGSTHRARRARHRLRRTIDEPFPEWQGTVDWLGLQYYLARRCHERTGCVPATDLADAVRVRVEISVCVCLRPDQTYCVGQMGYDSTGPRSRPARRIREALSRVAAVVTESGIASDVGTRRAEQIVRTLEAIAAARDSDGVDVRGFYEWSLTDNFEWAQGFAPHFRLYSVDDTTYARTATEGATVLARSRLAHGDEGPARAVRGHRAADRRHRGDRFILHRAVTVA